jgi:exopolysaccharide production protein ExoZ
MPVRTGHLASLEVGRGVAALLVVAYHLSEGCAQYFGALPLGFIFRGGHAGVEYFFVLSGFIIYYVHREDIGQGAALARFCKRRLIRIVPMYWLVISAMLVAFALHPQWGSSRSLDLGSIVMDYLLVPRAGTLVLPPAWTLQREAIFYAIFAMAIVAPRPGLTLFFAWQMAVLGRAIAVIAGAAPTHPLIEALLGAHNLGFLVGVSCAWLMLNRPTARPGTATALAWLGALGLIGATATEWLAPGPAGPGLAPGLTGQSLVALELGRSLAYSGSCGLLVYGFASRETCRPFRIPKALTLLGASSYAIYLLHEPLSSLFFKILVRLPVAPFIAPDWAFVIVAIAVVLVAACAHLAIEAPMTARLRAAFLSGARQERAVRTVRSSA